MQEKNIYFKSTTWDGWGGDYMNGFIMLLSVSLSHSICHPRFHLTPPRQYFDPDFPCCVSKTQSSLVE